MFVQESFDFLFLMLMNKIFVIDHFLCSLIVLIYFYYINNCHGYIEELCITDRNEKTGYRNEKLETITESKFKSLKLKEIDYIFNEKCQMFIYKMEIILNIRQQN